MQAQYQYGNLTLRKRKKGPDVWQFRWAENGKPKSMFLGTLEALPTKDDAMRAAEPMRMRINSDSTEQRFYDVTVGMLIDRFMAEYAPKRCRLNTQTNYRSLFKNHVRPRWEGEMVKNVKAMAIEDWLEEYSECETAGNGGALIKKPVSRQVKSHVRNLMHTLFHAALRWEIIQRNPVDMVRQPRKRLKTPRVLTPGEFKALLGELCEPYRAMVITIACLGLRVSELLGLQWGDVDFENLTVKIQRSVVEGQVNLTKTEASESLIPLDPDLAEVLLGHKAAATFSAAGDFVFAGATGKPRWKDSILSDYLKPAASRAKIGSLGWHTFRHTYSTLLHAFGATPAVQKELLRHANIQTTLNIYTQAISADKREAATKVAGVLWKN